MWLVETGLRILTNPRVISLRNSPNMLFIVIGRITDFQ